MFKKKFEIFEKKSRINKRKGDGKMEIIFRGKSITHSGQSTILETLEKGEMKTFSMCREGYCATCKMTLKSGEVEYIDEPIAILDDNEFLPCICRPKTDIEIDY